MKNAVVVISFGLIFLGGCVKESEPLLEGHIIDVKYPTTYHQLSTEALNSLKEEYLYNKDTCFQTSLNNYGFCASSNDFKINCTQNCTPLNQARARKLVMEFLQTNKKYSGIADTSMVKITSYQAFGKSYLCNATDSSLWNVSIGNQTIENMEVVGTGIYFRLNNDGVIQVVGNWYPLVSIPKKEAISYETAKTKLIGKQYDFVCWTPIHLTINKDTQWQEPLKRKIIFPYTRNNAIELHVVWVLQTGDFNFYIDEISGEVLAALQNVIC